MDSREDNGSDTSEGASGPVVRPFGYVETEAVVRRIGDRDLYLGNKFAAIPGEYPEEFDFVISATDEAFPRTTHHRPLIDGSGNEWADFEAAVDTARTLFDADGRLLIHCMAGISRSSTLVATAIAAEEGRSFREALRTVQEARPFAMPNPALHELAVVYLAANG